MERLATTKGDFFETICLENGELQLLPLHNERMNATRAYHYGCTPNLSLADFINIPPEARVGRWRCRVSYAQTIQEITFSPYELKVHREVAWAELKAGENYSFKAEDRRLFEEALKRNPAADDVIFTQQGFLTDATYANIALFDGTEWFTPETCLLRGVKRHHLLQTSQLKTRKIKLTDLPDYQQIAFINALRDFELIYKFTVHENGLSLY